jgi:3-oxoacyl-[acyl-carrier protein] reductase
VGKLSREIVINYRDKSIIITGAYGFLGRGLSLEFARRGAKIAICGRSRENLEELCSEILTLTDKCIYREVDVSSKDQIKDFIAYVAHEHGGVDVLVNNAAVINYESFYTLTDQMIEDEIRINYLGPVYLMKEAIPLLLDKEQGQVININSNASYIPYPFLSSYSATKAALSAFTDAIRIEFHENNLNLINVYVGMLSGGQRSRQNIIGGIKNDRKIMGGMPSEIAAKIIIKNASRGTKYIHTHKVDRFIYYFIAFIAPFYNFLLYRLKVKNFGKR